MNKQKVIIITLIGIFGVAGFFLLLNVLSQQQAVNQEPTTSEVQNVPLATEDSSTGESQPTKYKNGVYSTTANYNIPQGGKESINISLTLEADTIKTVSISGSKTVSDSAFYQNSFIDKIEENTVGKKIDEIQLSRVGGASLTTPAFVQVLEKIKSEAQN